MIHVKHTGFMDSGREDCTWFDGAHHEGGGWAAGSQDAQPLETIVNLRC